MHEDLIFITGYAKFPGGITAQELYSVIAVGVIVNKQTGVIEDVDCSLVTTVARQFVRDLLVDRSIVNYDQIQAVFKARYHGSARKALLSALKIINEKFEQIQNNLEVEDE